MTTYKVKYSAFLNTDLKFYQENGVDKVILYFALFNQIHSGSRNFLYKSLTTTDFMAGSLGKTFTTNSFSAAILVTIILCFKNGNLRSFVSVRFRFRVFFYANSRAGYEGYGPRNRNAMSHITYTADHIRNNTMMHIK